MRQSTYTRGELTVHDAAMERWSRGLPAEHRDDPGTALIDQLTSLITENDYSPISTHWTDDGLYVELYGDYCSSALQVFLDDLGRSGATGRVWFPEDGMWGYDLTADGTVEKVGTQVYPGDELLLLTVEIPGRDRHRAIYDSADNARKAVDRHLADWAGGERRSADLEAALAAICAAGGNATCEALPYTS